jgi:PAS domain S-box-containing protein
MRFKDLPIRQKLVRVILLTCSVTLFLTAGAYILYEYFTNKKAEKSKVATMALVIASNSSAALAFQSQDDAIETLNALRADRNVIAACLYDPNNAIFAKYPADASDDIFPSKPSKTGYFFERDYIVGFQPVQQDKLFLGTLYIQSSLKSVYAQIWFNSGVALILILASLLVGYILSRKIQTAISEPVISLERTARIITDKGDYSMRAEKSGNDELGSLTDAFNSMISRIQEQRQEIVKANEESSKLAAIVESSGDAIIGYSLDHVITSWNPSAERILGFTAEEMIGKPAAEVLPNTNFNELAVLTQPESGGQLEGLQTQFVCKDGSVLDISLTISPVKDTEGNLIGTSQIARDITRQKDNERKIIENAEHFRLATEAAELGTFDMNLDVGQTMP